MFADRSFKPRRPVDAWFPARLREGWIYAPSKDGVDANLLILLHGLGDGPLNFAKLADKMALPGTASLALLGPLRLSVGPTPGGMWFRCLDEAWSPAPAAEVSKSFRKGITLLVQLLEALHDQGGWPYERMHLLGFSHGGSACLGVANRLSIGSCISISGSLPVTPASVATSEAATPVLISHGARDTELSRADVDKSVSQLRAAGHSVEFHEVPGKGHAMISSEPEMRVLMDFWAKVLKAPPPAVGRGEEILEVRSQS